MFKTDKNKKDAEIKIFSASFLMVLELFMQIYQIFEAKSYHQHHIVYLR